MKHINPIKKLKLKKNLLEHPERSLKENVRDAGYSEYTAANATRLKSVKLCLEEIEREFKESDVTVEMVIQQLQATRQLAIAKNDLATAAYCSTQLGKYLCMFTDKVKSDVTMHPEQKDRLNRLSDVLTISEQ